MRSRGINLAEVRAGLGDSGADARGGGQFAESGGESRHTSGVSRESAHESDISDVAGGVARDEDSGTTYRG
jgi:hypothetical protein